MVKKYLSSKILLVTFAFIAIFALGGIVNVVNASNTVQKLKGYSWSDAIGWISFNCETTSTCGISNYAVQVAADGRLSGYAWSDSVGWISFEGADATACPSGSGVLSSSLPKVDLSTGKVTGYARLYSAKALPGFDYGCISLSDTQYYQSPVTSGAGGVTFKRNSDPAFPIGTNIGNFIGYAWGAVLGWIQFDVETRDTPPLQTFTCGGSVPAHVTGSSLGASTYTQGYTTTSWTYNASKNACQFVCDGGYSWNSGSQTCDAVPNNPPPVDGSCIAPENSLACPGNSATGGTYLPLRDNSGQCTVPGVGVNVCQFYCPSPLVSKNGKCTLPANIKEN